MFVCRFHIKLALVVCALLSSQTLRTPGHAQAHKPVLAFYYAWYDHSTWSKTPDVPQIQYKSTDVEAMARHIDWARSAGIDGFVVSWYGPEGGVNNQTQSNVLALLDIAAARGFKIAIDFETRSPLFKTRAQLRQALRYAVDTLARHPAYFRHNDQPVIFFWRNDALAPGEWLALRAQADPENATLWIAEGVSTQWLITFDGLHLYNVAWSRDFAATASKFAGSARKLGRLWVGTAMPGWNDTKVRGRAGAHAKDRANGQFYRDSFAAAAASDPDLLVITSFNEWMEGSQLEPSVTYGDFYLNLTRELIARYRAGMFVPTPTATPLPTLTPIPTLVPTPTAVSE